MIIFRIFSDFCDSSFYKKSEELLILSNVENYNKHFRFTEGDDYTHVIIFNKATPEISHINKDNVIGLAYEPNGFLFLNQEFINYAKKYIGKYYIGDATDLEKPFIGHISYMPHSVKICKTLKPKNKLMSIIFSNKQFAFGHIYRYQIIEKILHYGLPIDIYGRGCKNIIFDDPRIKGEFSPENSHIPYEDYLFSIAIENFELPYYFSEKYTNCLYYDTTPIYYGSPVVDELFPNSHIRIDNNVDKTMNTIIEILRNPLHYKRQINRQQVAEKMNLIKYLDDIYVKPTLEN